MADKHHVVVDGSNLATEGRTLPSLRQLDEAVRAYAEEDPDAEIVVVVDASFEHRIDPAEQAQLEEAELHGEVVSPPAGAIGRGDAFVLRIAERTGAKVLSNDSFQEFHGEHPWLFEEGRLIGGKPVPGVGWIFTPRNPVRGPKSRQSTGKTKRGAGREASLPAPIKAAELARAAKKVAARRAAVMPDGSAPKIGDVWDPAAVAAGLPEEKPKKPKKAAPAAKVAKAKKAAKVLEAAPAKKVAKAAPAAKAAKAAKAAPAAKVAKAKKAAKVLEAAPAEKAAPAKKVAPAAKAAPAAKVAKAKKAAKVLEAAPAKKAAKTAPAAKAVKAVKVAKAAVKAVKVAKKAVKAGTAVPAAQAAKATKVARVTKATKAAAELAEPAEPAEAADVTQPVDRGIVEGITVDNGDASAGRRGRRPRIDPQLYEAIEEATAEALSPPEPVVAKSGKQGKPVGKEPRSESKSAKRRRGASTPPPAVNEPLEFITFVTTYPLGSEMDGEVASFTSHGAMVEVGTPDGGSLHCYVPLTGLGDPPPHKARQVLRRGEHRTFVLVSLDPLRRVAELALPGARSVD